MNVIFKNMLWVNFRLFLLFSIPLSSLAQTDSLFPSSYSNPILTNPIRNNYKSSNRFFNWILNKPLLKIQDSSIFITIDPVFNLTQFKSLIANDSIASYRNTRGFAIRGQIGSKLRFESLFTENQGFFPNYQRDFIQYYSIYPGQGRVKSFKNNGYDFAQAQGKIDLQILKQWRCSFGNGKNVIGNGYRSLLLSDAGFSYPYLANQVQLSKYVKHTILQAWLQNLERIPAYSTSEASFKRKYVIAYYTQFFPIKNLDLGIFNSSLINGYDSIKGNSPASILFYQPIPFLNQVLEKKNNNTYFLSGLNISYTWPFLKLYGQYVLDFKGHSGYQLGTELKIIKKSIHFTMRVEQNKVNPILYQNNSHAYIHYNQSLAHPQGHGFYENLLDINMLCFHRFGLSFKYIHTKFAYDSISYTANTLIKNDIPPQTTWTASMGYTEASAYIVLNTWYNMTLYTSWTNRVGALSKNDQYLSFGIKSNLYREYFDF